ncbi:MULTISPECIES: glycosyltransferase [unclassified Pantoea]|uniref:glycosyltransferase n=1 Tax=unclassified Pantoea TaxID=2630326 RepID=UPI00226A3897|nr:MULTISPECIES: glycosyltransferase [unclassified Pantoea]
MKKILIMTPDIEGPVRNGGIGTAFTALATMLAKNGFDIDVLYTSGAYSESTSKSFKDWAVYYSKHGVNLLSTQLNNDINIDAPYFRKKSYSIYLWLKENNIYDVIISCEWQADLYYSLLIKKQGINFTKTKFIINTHSSTLWSDEGNYQLPYDQNHLELYHMEKAVTEMADEVISPSQYLFDWMQAKGWDLTDKKSVILNCAPFQGFEDNSKIFYSEDVKTSDEKIELVFFGRLETRKGLDIFLRALKNLSSDDKKNLRAVTFLGKKVNLGSIDSETHIRNSTRHLELPVNIISDYDRTNANNYIKRKNTLVIIPSLVENSPYTVYECLINNVNFLASSVGGIPELIPRENHTEILFQPNPVDLYGKIHSRLKKINCETHLIADPKDIENSWLQCLRAEYSDSKVTPDKDNLPLVSVCITHHDRHHLLQQAVASIKAQTYSNIEVVIVDDGSEDEDSHKYLDLIESDFNLRNWKIIRSSNNYLGAARNLAAKHASGDFLLFMDDDNVAKPHEVETFIVAAINSGADILTTPSDLVFNEEYPSPFRKMTHCWLPLGADLNIASFNNCFGDANALIKKEVFQNVGGFTEDYGLGHEDWEFFSKAVLKGHSLQLVPEPLFWYRVANSGMLLSGNRSRNNYRSFRPFMDENVKYNFALGLMPAYMEKIAELEREIHRLQNLSSSQSLHNRINTIQHDIEWLISQEQDGWAHDRFNSLNNKLEMLISQQQEGWAHDRFNVLNDNISRIHREITMEKVSLTRKVLRKIKSAFN